jgi:hypothetical protein
MSITNSFDEAFDLSREVKIESALAHLRHSLAIYWVSLTEALAAARSYDELIRQGVPHDAAIRKVFDAHFAA